MEFLPPANHIACQSFQRFMVETLGLHAESACTCLADGRDILCQRYPNLANLVVAFYAQAEEFRRALLPPLQNADSACERDLRVNENERTPSDLIGPFLTLEPSTAPVERDDAELVSAVDHFDFAAIIKSRRLQTLCQARKLVQKHTFFLSRTSMLLMTK